MTNYAWYTIMLSVFFVCVTAVVIKGCDVNHDAEMKCFALGDGHYYLNWRCYDKNQK